MDYGELPEKENCEISRWELGTLNYEALAGFCGTEEYLAGLAPNHPCLDAAFSAIEEHEEKISAKFLQQVHPLLEAGKLKLLGSTNPNARTPTFALSQPQVPQNMSSLKIGLSVFRPLVPRESAQRVWHPLHTWQPLCCQLG